MTRDELLVEDASFSLFTLDFCFIDRFVVCPSPEVLTLEALGEDMLLHVLSLCDVYTVLKVSAVFAFRLISFPRLIHIAR